MSNRYAENVKQVTDWRVVETDGYMTFEADYVTAGGLKKTLRLAHSDADVLRTALASNFEDMDPATRTRSFEASARRKR